MPYGVTIENLSCFGVELTIGSKNLGPACLEAVHTAIHVVLEETACIFESSEGGDEIVTVNLSP